MKVKNISSKNFHGFAGITIFFVIAFLVGIIVSYYAYQTNPNPFESGKLPRYSSCQALAQSIKTAQQNLRYFTDIAVVKTFASSQVSTLGMGKGVTEEGIFYSQTNVQVEGVDEADMVKTDGEYIYTVTSFYDSKEDRVKNKLIIAKAYPPEEADIISETELGEFVPQEIFIHNDKLLIFGSTSKKISYEEEPSSKESSEENEEKIIAPMPPILPYYYLSFETIQIFDVSEKTTPSLIRSFDFEGNYLSSRKIGPYVYFVVNSYPKYHILEKIQQGNLGEEEIKQILPLYRETFGKEEESEFNEICGCDEVAYFEPEAPQSFITIASISLDNPMEEIKKQTIVGFGENIYASLSNLYIAEVIQPWMDPSLTNEQTRIHKFSLKDGEVSYVGFMNAPGHILNQFSMDEYENYFRIATTIGMPTRFLGGETRTSNNVYIFDENLEMVGKLEDVAPGESIYSARFLGDRVYLVTFKKVDPFFVIDLSEPTNPKILGKLKIPGYSNYLHPYDENHIIGIGKETVEAESEEGQPANFAWYQGVKMAIFDVSDVANPKELHKVVIGDRGTDSYALYDHKAFLFDREKQLLVIPILLAELSEDQKQKMPEGWPPYGEYKYQGAYVYEITLENGFVLKGRVTHYDDEQTFAKTGEFYYEDAYTVKRSLYIDDILYTISNKKIKLNDLKDLTEIKQLVFAS